MNTFIALLSLLLSPFGIEVGSATAPSAGADSTDTCLVATLQRTARVNGEGRRIGFHLCVAVDDDARTR